MSTSFYDSTGYTQVGDDLLFNGVNVNTQGQSFTTPSGSWKFNVLKLGLRSSLGAGTFHLTVNLYADNGASIPTVLIQNLVNNLAIVFTDNVSHILTIAIPTVVLAGSTRYWIFCDSSDTSITWRTANTIADGGFNAGMNFNAYPPTSNASNGPNIMLAAGDPAGGIGNNRFGVRTFLQPVPGNQIPYRLCVNNNRLHCLLPGNDGLFTDFVYYLGRENNQGGYWYRYVVDPSAMISEEDGNLYAGFGDGGVGSLFNLDVANVSTFAGSNINVNVLFPMSKEEFNQRKDMFHLRFHIDTGNTALNLTGYTDFGAVTAFSLGTITTNGVQQFDLLVANTNFNLAKRIALQIVGATPYFKLIDWSVDYDARPEPLSFLRIATNYGLASKKRLRTVPIVIDTRGQQVGIQVIADGVSLGTQNFTTNERTTVYYLMNTDVFATDLIINISATTGNTFEFYEAPSPVNVETLPVPKLFDQIGPIELERIGALLEFRVRMLATTNTITYNVFMDDIEVITGKQLSVALNVDKTYGPFKMPKGIQGTVCRIEFLSSGGVFYRWNCKLKFTTGGTKSDTKQVTIQDASMGIQK